MTTVTYDQLRELLPGARSYSGYTSGLCPFHDDKNPSLLLFEDGFFRCLGCGVTGGFEKLHRKLRGYDASRVIPAKTEFCAPRLPTDLREQEELIEVAHESLTKFEQLHWYLDIRGVSGRIDQCRLGWYKGWYTVPVYSRYGEYRGMVARAGSEIQKATGMRFIQPHGQHPMLYCPDWNILDTAKAIAFVFGIFDAIAISDLRFAVVTSTGGKDSFDPKWLEPFRKPVIFFPDKGEEDTAIKHAGKLGWRGSVWKLEYPDDIKDPAGFLETGRRQGLINQIGGILS